VHRTAAARAGQCLIRHDRDVRVEHRRQVDRVEVARPSSAARRTCRGHAVCVPRVMLSAVFIACAVGHRVVCGARRARRRRKPPDKRCTALHPKRHLSMIKRYGATADGSLRHVRSCPRAAAALAPSLRAHAHAATRPLRGTTCGQYCQLHRASSPWCLSHVVGCRLHRWVVSRTTACASNAHQWNCTRSSRSTPSAERLALLTLSASSAAQMAQGGHQRMSLHPGCMSAQSGLVERGHRSCCQ
jgi:hypothetical protein